MSCFLVWFHVNHLPNKFLEVGSSSGYHWNIHDETYVSVEVSRNSRHWIPPRRPTKTGELKLTFGWLLKLPIPRFNEMILEISHQYIYISCFLKKQFVSIFSYSFLHQYFVKGFPIFPLSFPHSPIAWQVRWLDCVVPNAWPPWLVVLANAS